MFFTLSQATRPMTSVMMFGRSEIESMPNLGKLIGFVAKSFEFQVNREKGLEDFMALVPAGEL